MDSSVQAEDKMWFLRVGHQVPHELYCVVLQAKSGLGRLVMKFLDHKQLYTHA